MFVTFIIISLAIMSTQVQAEDSSEENEEIIRECLKKHGVTFEELKHFRKDDPSEKILCAIKCRYEKMGIIDEKGQIVKEVIQDRLEDFGLKEKEKNKFQECTDKIESVKKCTDLSALLKCIPEMDLSQS